MIFAGLMSLRLRWECTERQRSIGQLVVNDAIVSVHLFNPFVHMHGHSCGSKLRLPIHKRSYIRHHHQQSCAILTKAFPYRSGQARPSKESSSRYQINIVHAVSTLQA